MREARRLLEGRVTSSKMDKTVVVTVERSHRHPLYGKVVRSRKKYVAHDESNGVREGDLVAIRESRPISRTKRWVVEKVLGRERLAGE